MNGLNTGLVCAIFCFFACLTAAYLPFGFTSLAITVIATLILVKPIGLFQPRLSPIAKRAELRTLVMAFLGTADLIWILSKAGWGDGTAPYFRPPFHHDLERHLILINAILRKSGSPFFPNAPLGYQSLWHHGIAAMVGPWTHQLSYAAFRYFIFFTALLFFWSCLSAIARVRPSLLLRAVPALFIGTLLFTHADIFNFILSSLYQNELGIEADWSFRGPLIFRMNSLKMLALTAPQNVMFGILLFGFLQPKKTKPQELLLVTLLAMSSPPLAILFLVPFYFCEILREKKVPYHLLFCAVTVPLAFQLAYRYSPMESFDRPAIFSLQWFPSWLGHWVCLPLILAGLLGMPGLILTFLMGAHLWRKSLIHFGIAMILVPLLGYNVATDIELRRHISILCSLLVVYFIACHWRILKFQFVNRFSSTAAVSAIAISLLLHGYFIYCYVGKPSVLSAQANWKAYLEMRDLIALKYSGLPILSAVSPNELGLSFSPILEATTSFAGPLDAAVHSVLNPVQRRQLASLAMGKNIAEVALQVGYRAILWGPVEEKVWGAAVRLELGKTWIPIEHIGPVGLFRLAPFAQDSEKRKTLG